MFSTKIRDIKKAEIPMSRTLKIEKNIIIRKSIIARSYLAKSLKFVYLGGLEFGTTLHNEKSKCCLYSECFEAGASTSRQSPDLILKLS